MKLEPSELRPIRDLALRLFKQASAFGRLGLDVASARQVIEENIARVALTKSIWEILEEVSAPPEFTADQAFVYNSIDWPAQVSAGGYMRQAARPTVAQLLNSYLCAWSNAWAAKEKSSTFVGRPLSATLNIFHSGGLDAAIRYIVDLHSQGFLLSSESTISVLSLFLSAYIRSDSPATVVSHFFPRSPETPRAWIEMEIEWPEFSAPVLGDKAEEAGEALLALGLDLSESIRESTNFDDWLLGQWTIDSFLKAVRQIIPTALHLSHGPIWHGLEEVMCDAGAVRTMCMGGTSNPLTLNALKVMRGLMIIVKANGGSDWRERLLQERTILPYALDPYVSDDLQFDNACIPDEWQRASTNLAPIIAAMLMKGAPLSLFRSGSAPASEPTELHQRLIYAMECPNRSTRCSLLEKVLSEYPLCDFAYTECAIALDESGEPKAALERITKALELDPTGPDRWQSYGIILNRCGFRSSAILAAAVKHMIEEREGGD